MPKPVKVFSAPGTRVPREENPRKYYPVQLKDAVEVPRSPYVERLLLTGDLVEVAPATAVTADVIKPTSKKKE